VIENESPGGRGRRNLNDAYFGETLVKSEATNQKQNRANHKVRRMSAIGEKRITMWKLGR